MTKEIIINKYCNVINTKNIIETTIELMKDIAIKNKEMLNGCFVITKNKDISKLFINEMINDLNVSSVDLTFHDRILIVTFKDNSKSWFYLNDHVRGIKWFNNRPIDSIIDEYDEFIISRILIASKPNHNKINYIKE